MPLRAAAGREGSARGEGLEGHQSPLEQRSTAQHPPRRPARAPQSFPSVVDWDVVF